MFSDEPRAALVLVVIVLFAFLFIVAQSEEPPAKSMMHLGSSGLASTQAVLANNSSINSSSVNNISINSSTINNSSTSKVPIKNLPMNDKQMDTSGHAVPVIDLSNYAKDLKNKNLAGYRNVMYPMGELRGPPGSTAGGGGCGCG